MVWILQPIHYGIESKNQEYLGFLKGKENCINWNQLLLISSG